MPVGRNWSEVPPCGPEVGHRPFRCAGSGSAELQVCRQELPSTSAVSVYPGEFFQLLSTFRATVGLSVNFRQFSMQPGDLQSFSAKFSVQSGDLP